MDDHIKQTINFVQKRSYLILKTQETHNATHLKICLDRESDTNL